MTAILGRRCTVRYCSCGRPCVGKRSWRTHHRAHPTHRAVAYHEYIAIRAALLVGVS